MGNQFCTKCGAQAEGDSLFCTQCGAKLEKKIFCQKCGTEVKPSSVFCHACGAALNKATENAPKAPASEPVKVTPVVKANEQPVKATPVVKANEQPVKTATVVKTNEQPVKAATNQQAVEKAPKAPAQKQSKSTSIPIGKNRTKSRKIADLLLFFAAAILLIVPLISFVEISGLNYNPGFELFGKHVAYPTGYQWGTIRILSSLESLFDSFGSSYESTVRLFFAIGLMVYFTVLYIVSIVSIIKSIIYIAKGRSEDVMNKALGALAGILSFCIYSSFLSTSTFDVRLSPLMKLSLAFSILLILAAAVLLLVTNIKNRLASKKTAIGAIFSLFMLAFSLVCALSFIGFRCYDYIGSSFSYVLGSNTQPIYFALSLYFVLPTMIIGLILIFRNRAALKQSFSEATFSNYEKSIYGHTYYSPAYKTASFAALSSVFLTLSFGAFLLNVASQTIDYNDIYNIVDVLTYNFSEYSADFILVAIRQFLPAMSFPIFIWGISVVALIVHCVCNSLAKKANKNK